MKRFACALAALGSMSLLALAADTAPATRFKTDQDGFVVNWLILDSIRLNGLQHNEAGVQAIVTRDAFKELLAALPKAGDTPTVDGTQCTWHAVNSKEYIINLTGLAGEWHKPVVNCVFWGVAYIYAPEEMKEARLAIGSDDDSVWWVNGKQVIAAYGVRQTSVDDNVSKRLTLNQGINVVRFAVIQGDGPSDCCVRFYDAKQKVISSLTILLDPPPASATKTAP